jgi:hypothetical protein
MSRTRFALVCALFVAFTACTVFAVLRVIAPPPAPAQVQPAKPLSPRLTRHVLFVIVDGLRYDVATDPARMPHFAAAMARESSAEIWAGRISMTTSAVLSMATGQRGRLEQIVRNLSPGPPPHNSWLQNAQAAGLRVATVGDPAWSQCFGPHLFQHRDDPAGVAIDVDFNPQTFRNTRELLKLAPDLLVAHFVTPDHQGHAYGVVSARYTAHIRAFDAQLEQLLGELGPDWTVVVTSDHGASDTGKHGTDVAVQRRSPIYAYGPGIRRGVKLTRPLDQLELASTLPTLLGLPAPAHRTGHVIAEWLDLPLTERAELACENAQQVLAYARQVAPPSRLEAAEGFAAGCRAAALPDGRSALALRSVTESDLAVDASTGLLSPGALPWLLGIVGVGLLLVFTLAPPTLFVRGFPAVALLIAVTVLLVLYVERLPGNWPDTVRALALVLGNLGLLLLLVRPARFASLAERLMPHAPALVPAPLVISYTADTRPEAYAAMAVCAIVYAVRGQLAPSRPELASAQSRFHWHHALALAFGLLALLPVVLHENEGYSRLIASEQLRPFAYAGLLFAWFVWQERASGARLASSLGFALFAAICFALRSHAGPFLGRIGWALSGVCFVALCLKRGQPFVTATRAVSVGVLAFAWVSRDFELLPLLGCVTLAQVVSERIATRQADDAAHLRPSAAELMVQSLFAFALTYALRLGIQDGVDFGGMDWHAGAFADPNVSATVVGAALVYKYVLATLIVLVAAFARLPPAHEQPLLIAVAVCFIVRALALSLMFFIAGNSYWTATRVLGDLPTALAMSLAALLALASSRFRSTNRASASS